MKVGIIGIGAISRTHISALINNKQDIVALCDIKEEKCIKAKEDFSLSSKVYTDYKKMLDENDLDVIHICTPHYLHAEMVCEGLGRNINVLCEKPLGISLEQLEAVENAVKNSKAQLGVCFQNRFNATSVYLKDFLKDKKFVSAYATVIWQRNAAYYAQDKWRGTWAEEGGGVMINQAIHTVDLMQWLCGMPETVIANIANHSLKNEIEVEDTAFGIFKQKDGSNFIISATNAANFTFSPYCTIRTEADTVEFCRNNIIINGNTISKEETMEVVGKSVWGTGHQKLISNFYSCIETGEKFAIGYEEACKAVKLVLAMYRSNGQEINI